MDQIWVMQLLVSVVLVVMIWLVQLAHYPIFEFIEEKIFSDAMRFHQRAIAYIAMPLMLLELAITAYMVFLGRPLGLVLLVIVSAIWLSTFLIQVPLHHKLTHKKDHMLIRRLVNSNWIRTILWSIKLLIVVYASL